MRSRDENAWRFKTNETESLIRSLLRENIGTLVFFSPLWPASSFPASRGKTNKCRNKIGSLRKRNTREKTRTLYPRHSSKCVFVPRGRQCNPRRRVLVINATQSTGSHSGGRLQLQLLIVQLCLCAQERGGCKTHGPRPPRPPPSCSPRPKRNEDHEKEKYSHAKLKGKRTTRVLTRKQWMKKMQQ